MSQKLLTNVEIYLDYATIPSLNYFLHFAENKDDKEAIRLFGLGRFKIPESIIQAYPKGIIQYYSVSVTDQNNFNSAFAELLQHTKNKLNLTFHLNLFHQYDMFIPLMNIYLNYLDKIESIRLYFYDDGAEGVVNRYKLAHSNVNLVEEVNFYQQQISQLLENRVLERNIDVLRYLWNSLYPSTYILLKTDYLDNNEKLRPIKSALNNHYYEMDISRFEKLSLEQQEFILSILNISQDEIKTLEKLTQEHNAFIFTGTTIFNGNMEVLEKVHIDTLLTYLNPKYENYVGDTSLVFYKGHPHSIQINQKVAEKFENVVILPDSVPLEILYFLKLNLAKVGGFASTLYFFLKPENIGKVIFITDRLDRDSHYLFQSQYILSQIMIELGYIEKEQVCFYQDIYQ